MSSTKGIPMVKDEVALLIDLVEANKVITSKATNATNNQLKEVAWSKITDQFNASISTCPRRCEQLKLKWENLKKSARKRSAKIRMNQIKTGGGRLDYIPPDEALDRVASILGATCGGYAVTFGGDSEATDDVCMTPIGDIESGVGSGGSSGDVVVEGAPSDDQILLQTPKPKKLFFNTSGGSTVCGDVVVEGVLSEDQQQASTPKPKKIFFSTPSGNSTAKQKRKLLDEDVRARVKRNQAIADYYILKKKKIALDLENLELVNRKLKLDLGLGDKN